MISSMKSYLIENGRNYNSNIRGFDTSGYKIIFSKFV